MGRVCGGIGPGADYNSFVCGRLFYSRTALLPPLCPSVYHTSAMGLGLS